jgi:hypothetical protein
MQGRIQNWKKYDFLASMTGQEKGDLLTQVDA